MNKFILKLSIQLIFLVLLLSSFSFYIKNENGKNEISSKTNKIVQKIEKINILMSSAVGAAGKMPEQYQNFLDLQNTASVNELKLLTNHKNGVVRCYSFRALVSHKNIDLFSIVKEHLNDDTVIETLFGCILSDQKVGDLFINLVTPQYEDLEVPKLTEKEKKTLDSLLIYRENNLDSRYTAIESAEPTAFLYPKVKELAVKFNNQSALVTLSKYKNPNDIDLILKNRDQSEEDPESGYFFTYKAIQNFPDVRFLPFLEKRLYETLDEDLFSQEWLEMYNAIASFKNQKSLELLEIPFTKVQNQEIKKYHINFVYHGILANKDKLYDDLFLRIWQDEHDITLEGFQYLLQLNSAKTLELTKRELIPDYPIKESDIVPLTNQKMITENLKETMLNFILLNDKTLAYSIINDKIQNADVHDFKIYTAKVVEFKDPRYVEALFTRLNTESNPHVYLEAVETLIAFKNDSINKRILEARKRNKNMNENWGSDSLDKILEKNNIK